MQRFLVAGSLLVLLVLPWPAEGAPHIGPGEADGISAVFLVDNEGRQRETFIIINPANNLNLIMGWNERSAGRNAGQGFVSSFDYGVTWGTSGEISDGGGAHSDPAILISPTGGVLGTAVFNYIHNDFTGVRGRRSLDGGVTFPGPAVMIQPDTGPGGAGTDKNWCYTDLVPGSLGFDNMYVTVTEFGGTLVTAPDDTIVMAASFDQGATWPVQSVPLDTPGDGLIVQGSNLSVISTTGATNHVWWEGTGPSPLPFDIQYSSRVGGGGAAIFGPVSVPASGVPPLASLTPVVSTGDFYGNMNSGLAGVDFRVNSFPYIATDNNPASPFYRNEYMISANSSAAAAGGGTDPDIHFWRYVAAAGVPLMSGPSVRNGIPILNDDGGTAEQMFPSITVAPDGTVEVFWLDTRNDPGGSPSARFDIYYTCSVDGGATWAANTRISPATFTHAGNTFIGDYDNSTTNKGAAPGGGGHTWRSYVVQNASGSGTDPVVQAVNNTGPTVTVSGPATIDCTNTSPQTYTAVGADVDGDPFTYSWTVTASNATGGFPFSTNTGTTPTLTLVLPFTPPSPQTYTISVSITDFFGATATHQTTTTVVDNTPPVVTAGLSRTMLWPASRGLLPVLFSYTVTDGCDPAPVRTLSVYSNEPNGVAPYAPDALFMLPYGLRLRAERAYPGPGRFYIVVINGVDASGNRGHACRSSIVPLVPTISHIIGLRAAAAAAEAACAVSPTDVPPPGTGPIMTGVPVP